MQRMQAGRSAQLQFGTPRGLARTADAGTFAVSEQRLPRLIGMRGISLDRQQKITEAVLNHVQELFTKIKHQDESVAPPEEMYVELRDRPSWVIPPGKVLAKWNIKPQQIVPLQPSSPRPAHIAMGKNSYRTAWGEFAIGQDATTVSIGFKLSPKFGRGDYYAVIADESRNVTLGRLKPAWTL